MGLLLAARVYGLARQSHFNFQNRNTEHQAQHSTASTTTKMKTTIGLLCFTSKV